MPAGIEVFRHVAAQELVIRNHSGEDVLYVVPGRTRRMDTAVSIPRGQLLYVWMNKEFTFATSWELFPLKRGPD